MHCQQIKNQQTKLGNKMASFSENYEDSSYPDSPAMVSDASAIRDFVLEAEEEEEEMDRRENAMVERNLKLLEEERSKARQKKKKSTTNSAAAQTQQCQQPKPRSEEIEPIDPESVIDAVREFVCLYNSDLSSNKDFDTRNNAWLAVCGRLEVPDTRSENYYYY